MIIERQGEVQKPLEKYVDADDHDDSPKHIMTAMVIRHGET